METKELTKSELNNIEQFISETFNEEELMEIKGGVSEYLPINNREI
ncbi:MAG: hypothetical protein H6Q14_2998 [Bacteroidetes bacterium]|nr:hypothetical protein [Bacteroidota bacterium]